MASRDIPDLTNEEARWWRRFERVVKDMPETLVVNFSETGSFQLFLCADATEWNDWTLSVNAQPSRLIDYVSGGGNFKAFVH